MRNTSHTRSPSYSIGHKTDCGRVREQNEDAYIAEPGLGVFCVIDGMGGHAGGELAASIASKQILGRMRVQDKDPATRVREAIALANRAIYQERERRPEYGEMACVVTLATVEENHVTVGHVGDTRLYQIRHNTLTPITQDHSPVGMLVREHRLTEVEAMKHPHRNLVSRDVGSADRQPFTPEFIDTYSFDLEADAALLLSTDGLFDELTPDKILAAVAKHAGNPQLAVDTLIRMANEAGGKDNVTAILVCGPEFAASGTVVAADITERLGYLAEAPPRRKLHWLVRVILTIAGTLLAALVLWKYPVRTAEEPSAATIYVDSEIVTEDAAHFRSLASAIGSAPSGAIIRVLGGRYPGPIALKAGVQLQAARGRDITLFLEGPSPAVVTADGLLEPTTVEGFRILAAGAPVAVEARGSWVILKNNTISGAAEAGVRASGGTLEMSRNHIEIAPATVGLLVTGSAVEARENQFNLLPGPVVAKAIEIDNAASEFRISVEKNELMNCAAECISGLPDWRQKNVVHPPQKKKGSK